MASVAFVCDTSLRTSHFGCQLVGQTFREQFARVGLDLIGSLPTKIDAVENWQSILSAADLVVINGEGSIHHGRFQSLIDLASSYPCALVNCVYQENPPNANLTRFHFISARESISAQAIQEQGVECAVVPDVLFASMFLNSYAPCHSPVKDLGVTDCAEKTAVRLGPFQLRYRPGFSPKSPVVGDYLDFLSQHRKLCIGRFHAAVAAAVLRIPFATWDSNTWKIRGMMEDMRISHLHFNNRQAATKAVPDELPQSVVNYSQEAKRKIHSMFDTLARIAEENMLARMNS